MMPGGKMRPRMDDIIEKAIRREVERRYRGSVFQAFQDAPTVSMSTQLEEYRLPRIAHAKLDLSNLNHITITIKGEWDGETGYAISAYCTKFPATAEEAIGLACCLLDDMKARLAGELMNRQEKARKEEE
jgi:hypothetical protein